MQVELLDCEELLTKRKFQEALDAAFGVAASLPPSSLETGGVRERAICVGIQALFELGRGEDAFSYATNAYAPCLGSQAPYTFIPPGVLKLLFKLRLHLDNGNPQQAHDILQPYISFITSADANAQAAASSTPVDEEALELFLLDCVYPKEGKQAVEEFLRSTNHALPPQAHAGLSAGMTAFFAELDARAAASAEAAEKPLKPSTVASDADSKSCNPGDVAHGGDAQDSKGGVKGGASGLPLPASPRKHQQEDRAGAARVEAGSESSVRSPLAQHNPLSSSSSAAAPPPASSPQALAQARQRRLLWALGLGSAASWLILVIVAARRGRLQVLRRLLQRWQQSVHVWGPLVAAFAFIFAFVVVVI